MNWALPFTKHYEEGHPFSYHTPDDSDWLEADEIQETNPRVEIRTLLQEYDPSSEFLVVLLKYFASSPYAVPFPEEGDMDSEIRGRYVDAEAEERQKRLTCTDFWAREYHLASAHAQMWSYHVD